MLRRAVRPHVEDGAGGVEVDQRPVRLRVHDQGEGEGAAAQVLADVLPVRGDTWASAGIMLVHVLVSRTLNTDITYCLTRRTDTTSHAIPKQYRLHSILPGRTASPAGSPPR